MSTTAIIATVTSLLIFLGLQIPTEQDHRPRKPCEMEYNDMLMQCIYMMESNSPESVPECKNKLKQIRETCNG